ncbi:MAG: hypothetical protein NPINA01_19680 [Nitrospinaceae bacterium]|nr:MAG: hypothetical protein NPINA01_19680 [Nitrospinaceae bacterium]
MKAVKAFVTVLLVFFLVGQASAGENKNLVIGKNLKVGMSVEQVIALLGIPNKFLVNRGTEPLTDTVVIEYPQHGVVIYIMSKKNSVDAVEVLPSFKGSFAEGIQIGAKFNDLIAKYGVPKSMNAQIARYPERGMFFQLEKEALVSAKIFTKNSQILDRQLIDR